MMERTTTSFIITGVIRGTARGKLYEKLGIESFQHFGVGVGIGQSLVF